MLIVRERGRMCAHSSLVPISITAYGQSGQKHGLAGMLLRVYGWKIYESVGASLDRACGLPHIYFIVVFVLIDKFRSSITRRVNEWIAG